MFVAHSGDGYGANRSLFDILFGLDKALFEPVLVAGSSGFLTQEVAKKDIPVYVMPFRRWTRIKFYSPVMLNWVANFLTACRMAFLARSLGVVLIYTNTGGVVSGALAARLAGIKHIWHVREEVSERPFEFKIIDRLSDQIIANSQATRKRFADQAQKKIAVVYNGFRVPPGIADKDREDSKGKLGLSGQNVLTLIGSIDERKGQKESVLAMPQILKHCPNTKLIFVGQSLPSTKSYETEVKRMISSLGIQQSVLFYGFKENLDEVYSLTDIQIVPSRYEAFGRVIVEGMLRGLPVIATNTGGIPEIIQDQKTGILIDVREPEVLAEAVIELFGNGNKRHQISQAARLSAINSFGMDNTINSIQKHIEETISH